jgi:hypothetical protein
VTFHPVGPTTSTAANAVDWINVATAKGARGDAVMLSDAVMSSSSAVLTSATAAFTAADVGKKIGVAGAGAAGANLVTTIAGYTSATSITLSVAASTAVNGVNYGYGTDNTTAFVNAVAAITEHSPPLLGGGVIYVPAGLYLISAALNWMKDGLAVLGDGFNSTGLLQITDNIPVVQVAGQGQNIQGLTFTYAYQQAAAQTGGICMTLGDDTAGSCDLGYYGQLRCQYGSKLIAINPAILTAAGMFSCTFENITLGYYSITALHLDANNFQGANAGTGFVLSNVYITNNPGNVAQAATSYAVFIRNYNELVVNQLNIEHSNATTQHAMGIVTCGNAVLNGIHCEGLTVSADNKGLLFINGVTNVELSGFTSIFNTFSGATSNPVVLFNGAGPSALILEGFTETHCTVTTPLHPLADFSTATNVTVQALGTGTTQTTSNTANASSATNRHSFGLPAAPAAFLPANPTATSSLTLVMMGLGSTCTYTPRQSGIVQVNVSGFGTTATGAAQFNVGPRYGTGAAPNNGDAVTGTRFGCTTDQLIKVPSISGAVAFGYVAQITGLTPGTAYWFDLSLDTNTGADAASLSNVSMTFAELPA